MEFKILRIKGNTSNVVKTTNRLLAFKTFVWWIITSDITEMSVKKDVKHGGLRPDLVVIDDLENDESMSSYTQKDKLEKWFDDTIKKPKFGDLIRVRTINGYEAFRYFSHFENGMCYCFERGEPIKKGSRTMGWGFWEHIGVEDGKQ